MATKITVPIPQDEIKESFVWRDWFQKLSNRVYGTMAEQDASAVVVTGGVIQATSVTTDTLYVPTGTDGQVLIGKTSDHSFAPATLTAGANITITNGPGSITITGSGATTGDVFGPASATDNAVTRFDTTTGKLIQNSVVIIDDTGNVSGVLSEQFSDGSATTLAAGKMWYNGTTGSLNFGMGGGNITQQVGEETFMYGKASAAITDSPLQIVYHTGTVGASGVITFAPTIAGITNINDIIGVATESLALNDFGRVTAFGVVRGITTNGTAFGQTWADDDVIWYDPVTGNPTNVAPVAPNIKVQIGTVISAGSGGSGSFQVLLRPGSVLGGTDSNVQFSSLANNNLIAYDSTLLYWKNVTPGSVTGVGSVANSLTSGTGISFSSGTTYNGSAAITINNSLPMVYPGSGIPNSTGTAWGTSYSTTGSGTVVALATSPSFTTPLLGTPTSGVLTTCTGYTYANLAGTIPTWNQNTTGSAASLTTGRTISITGDLAYTSTSFDGSANVTAAGTLATVNTNVGSFTNATLTVNGKGLITAASSGTAPVTSVTGTAPVVSSGGTTPAISMAAATTSVNGYLTSTDWTTFNNKGSGTVTSVAATAGTGISITGSPITTTGTLNITNTAPDQTVVLTASTGISTSGTYPNFTITNSAPDQTVALTGAGTTSITGTYPNFTITSNDSATGTVTSVAALTLGTTGTDLSSTVATSTTTPVITLNVPTASALNRGVLSAADWTTFNNKGSGTITSVTATSPVTSTGGTTPVIAIPAATTSVNGYLTSTDWTTFNNKGSGTVTAVSVVSANGFAGSSSGGATPALTLSTSITGIIKGNGTAISAATVGTDYSVGTSALATGILRSTTITGALSIAVAADFPTLNQSTTGSAATLTTPRAIYGNNFDGSAALTQVIASTYGGTGNGFAKLSGPATTEKTFTLPNASATILTDNAAVTVLQGGTGATTASGARTNLGLVIGTDVLAPTGSAASLTSFPTFNQNTTGTAANITATSNSTLTTLSVLSLPGSQVTGNISGNAANVTGTVAVANGGTGLTTTPANGALDIGNGVGFTRTTLTAGTNVSITNAAGSITINSSNPGGTVTSVAALTLGTTGTDLSSTVATGTTTPVITLNVPTASATNRGALSSADWTTFNNKGSGTVTSVSGTAGRITSTGGATPVLDLVSGIATAGTTGSVSLIPVVTIDTYGRVTSITTAANPQGTVTSVTGTSPVVSSGGATPAISLASGYGDTSNPYASKTANFVLAAPNGTAGVPTFRAVVATDIPTLNQNTTGSAATLTTTRAIYGNNFNGSAALTQIIASTYGGTGNGFTKFSGATTTEKTYTLPDATATILTSNAAVTVAQGGTGQTSYTNGQLLIGNTTGNTLTKTTLTAGTGISITNGTGSISIASTVTGTVTSVTGTSPVVSSGGTTPAISLAASYGDTQNPYASKTANFVLAAPNGLAGVPTFRAVVAADIPTLNQNTTGTAANVTGTVAIINGGTGQTTANTAFNALVPSQTTNSGKYLTTDGTNTSWATVAASSNTTAFAFAWFLK